MAETVKKSRIVSEHDDNLEQSLMEEFNIRLKSCMSQDDLQAPAELDGIYENVQVKTNGQTYDVPKNCMTSKEFLEMERGANFYEELSVSRPGDAHLNGYQIECTDSKTEENPYETVQTQSLPVTFLTDLSDSCEVPENPNKSVKDRMLLCTDDASCLLFTQTVTSPMLTPCEENIDFLKGIRRDSSQNGSKSDPLDEEVPITVQETVQEEHIYENMKNLQETIYENLREDNNALQLVQNIKETIEHTKQILDMKIETENFIKNEIYELDKSAETNQPMEIVEPQIGEEAIPAEIPEAASEESIEVEPEPKITEVTRQIDRFESNCVNNEADTNSNSNLSVSTQIETSFVETTTEMKSSLDGSLKKKKSKKSKKVHEKENISVSETAEENCYNVNVKSLCRSFGDLTKIEDDFERRGTAKTRTKSMSDVCDFGSDKKIENVFAGVSVKALREKFVNCSFGTNNGMLCNCPKRKISSNGPWKSSFSKFDALQKKNVLHVRSSDPAKAQEKFSGPQEDSSCKCCNKAVFQMEQIKAEKAIWHKNCFRCKECNKQLTVDTYQSHEGTLYCKPHFKALFAPKVVEDSAPPKPRKHELIIRESQPIELPPDVVRASDKPDLGLEELQSLNVRERFQVFEHHETEINSVEKNPINVKRSPSILSKLARFQAKGMDIGVADDSLNGIPIEESSTEEEPEEEELDGEDAELIRARKVQKEKPFHFVQMSDVKSKWELGEQNIKDERREERKQEIQSIRNRLFLGKQGKMKEAYQQAVMESESGTNVKKSPTVESCDTRSLKEMFEKGELPTDENRAVAETEDMSVFESGISKKSRSIFLELDANSSKPPQMSPVSPSKSTSNVRNAREAFLTRQTSEDVVKSSDQVDDVTGRTDDIHNRFKFFETYREPEKRRKEFRITPPRDGELKAQSPEREVFRDPEIVRGEEYVEDSVVAEKSHTATKMLNKFRQMEENQSKEQVPAGLKPLKRFTPPPEPTRRETTSEEESGEESEEEDEDAVDNGRLDEDLIEAQKAARAKQLRAKFERWEANEIKKEQNNSSVNLSEELGDEQSQIESTRSLRAKFESMRDTNGNAARVPRAKVNRFVAATSPIETCHDCKGRVYPLEKISVHGNIYHKNCFRCFECNSILRMDSYTFNQGRIYCMPHFKRLFISKGNYDDGFGCDRTNTM